MTDSSPRSIPRDLPLSSPPPHQGPVLPVLVAACGCGAGCGCGCQSGGSCQCGGCCG